MKIVKKIAFCLMCVLQVFSMSYGLSPDFALDSVKEFNKSLPQLDEASSNLGKNFGLASLTAIGKAISSGTAAVNAALTKAAVAIKTGTLAVLAAPATPYVAAGATASFVTYKAYRYKYPTMEQKIAAVKKETQLAKAQIEYEEVKITLLQKTEEFRNMRRSLAAAA